MVRSRGRASGGLKMADADRLVSMTLRCRIARERESIMDFKDTALRNAE
jgi:hypothetical protein